MFLGRTAGKPVFPMRKKKPCNTFHVLWQRETHLLALAVVIFSVLGRIKIHKVKGIHNMEDVEEKERQEKKRRNYMCWALICQTFAIMVFIGKIPTVTRKIQPQGLKASSKN